MDPALTKLTEWHFGGHRLHMFSGATQTPGYVDLEADYADVDYGGGCIMWDILASQMQQPRQQKATVADDMDRSGGRLSLQSFLDSQPLSQLVFFKHPIVEIDSEAHIDAVLRRMQQHNVLSLPVYDAMRKKYDGLITVFDIVVFVSTTFFDILGAPVSQFTLRKLSRTPVRSLIGTADYFKAARWRENGLIVADLSLSILDLLRVMSLGTTHMIVKVYPDNERGIIPYGSLGDDAHESSEDSGLGMRAGDAEPAGGVSDERDRSDVGGGRSQNHRILSQVDALRFLCRNKALFANVFDKTIESLGLSQSLNGRHFVTCGLGARVLEVFRAMFLQDGGVAAIVSSVSPSANLPFDVSTPSASHGQLIATLSPSDIRGIRIDSLMDLQLTVESFLVARHSGQLPRPVCVGRNATLFDAAVAMLIAGVHRVWVIDDDSHPMSVVRTCDVITCLLHEAEREAMAQSADDSSAAVTRDTGSRHFKGPPMARTHLKEE